MLRLFRSIRQGLLNEGKTSKYLRYAVGEILLVVIGILIALQVNTWNQNRLMRIEEIQTISKLITELEYEISLYDFLREEAEKKTEALTRAKQVFKVGIISDSHSFLQDLVDGAYLGWAQGRIVNQTYADLKESGNLGIIKDSDIRNKISRHYRNFLGILNRLDERETSYPNITFQYIPRAMDIGPYLKDTKISADLTDEELDEVARLIFESGIEDHITGEMNLGLYTKEFYQFITDEANELIQVLKDYQEEIQN